MNADPGQQAAEARCRGTAPANAADPGQQAWALMHRFVETHNRRGELAEALGFRLGGSRGKVLFQLRDGPVTLGQLAQANGVDAPYATLIVDKLAAHGLVERRPHPDDRRRKLVALTAAGHDAIATADAILLRPPPAISKLPADDLGQLAGLLTRLLEADAAEPDEGRSSIPAASNPGSADRHLGSRPE
ncbi:MarR family winged helix-turn-helix transcriptional regulator [Frankia sp. AiPs1]|uniref:MarR family winged helix-turn-helix transcriptional regulator n=1 Tax=Frankia sp. AiPs1 TaxID=573493 RepID=UPI0020447EB3|nr:MarR family winged helix-turn-helix transcriptional regulator [Frankia sp. AiPs1]MCM3923962.1 MarR family winged helix-turn-helix transcriptional regulator [Frankia sp. AiPs1]